MSRKPKSSPTAVTKRVLDALEVPETYRQPAEQTRRTDYPELTDWVCEQIAEGKSLAWCARERHFSVPRFLDWINSNEVAGKRYARAREASADYLADQMVEIADNPDLDPHDKRVRVDTRKWAAAKLKPQTYGDRTAVDLKTTVTLEQLVQQAILPAPATPAIEGSAVEITTPEESEE